MRWLPDRGVSDSRRAHRRPLPRLPGYLSLQLRHSFLELLPALHGILRLERGNNSIGPRIVPMAFTPPRIIPPTRPLGRFGFLATFVRNPLEVVPQAAYEED